MSFGSQGPDGTYIPPRSPQQGPGNKCSSTPISQFFIGLGFIVIELHTHLFIVFAAGKKSKQQPGMRQEWGQGGGTLKSQAAS